MFKLLCWLLSVQLIYCKFIADVSRHKKSNNSVMHTFHSVLNIFYFLIHNKNDHPDQRYVDEQLRILKSFWQKTQVPEFYLGLCLYCNVTCTSMILISAN